MPTNYHLHQTHQNVKSEIEIEMPNGTKMKADGNSTYVLEIIGGFVICFFIYMKFHKHVRSAISRRKKK